MHKKLIIFGTGDFARITRQYLEVDSDFEIIGFTANESTINEKEIDGLPVISFEQIIKSHPPKEYAIIVCIAFSKMNQKRAKIFNEVKNKGYKLESYIHSSTKMWDNCKIGENCLIFENNTIQPFVEIGNDVIIQSGNVISHNTNIKDHCFITSSVSIAGHVTIDEYSFLGMNCTIKNRIKIGKKCIIGAGAVILKNTKDKQVFSGKEYLLSGNSEMLEL